MKTQASIWKLFALLALLAPAAVDARPPMSREWRGTLTALDAQGQTLTVTDHQRQPLALRWNERTRFVADARFTTADVLRRGAAVEVRYRSPIFGGPYASKVVLLSPSTSKTKTNKP